jgi:ABC-2 type transport system permease protein
VFSRAFSRGLFGTLLIKEWRLILRAPQLLSQVLLQVLYMIPLLFVAFRHGSSQWTSAAFVAGITGISSVLATALAWLTIAAEDAPDLLAGSPHRRSTILGAKLFAAASPPIALVCIAAIGVASTRSVTEAVLVVGYGTAACISAAILSAASPATGKRTDFQKRNSGRRVGAVVEMFQFLIWAAAAGSAASDYVIAAAILSALGCVLPGLRLPTALRQFDD